MNLLIKIQGDGLFRFWVLSNLLAWRWKTHPPPPRVWIGLRTTVPLVSYIRISLRLWYYTSLSICCENLEKKFHFAFRRSLRNSVPLHGKRNFVWQAFLEKKALELHGMVQAAWGSVFQVYPHIRIIITVVRTSVS